MQKQIIILIILAQTTLLFSQKTTRVSDFEFLHNTSWSGSLMYVNYADGKEVNLRTTMQLEIKEAKIVMHTQYPDEPSANSKSSMKLKKGGTFLGDERIIERTNLKNGTLKIVTQFQGKDNNNPATMTKTYLLDENEFSITKKVMYENSEKAFVRNKYTYKRI